MFMYIYIYKPNVESGRHLAFLLPIPSIFIFVKLVNF